MGAVDMELFRMVPQNVAMVSCPQPTPCVFRFSNETAGVFVVIDSAVHCESCQLQLRTVIREISAAIRRLQMVNRINGAV